MIKACITYSVIVLAVLVFLPCPAQNAASSATSAAVLKTATGEIFGTLTMPNAPGKVPVVLIIAGSGPTDRDGNSIAGVKSDAYKMLADSLALDGIATLRYDKRGIAASKAAMKSESELRFDDYVSDAAEWIAQLRDDARFGRVVVLGHSEGSLIGMLAAARAGADAFISLAGAGKPAGDLLREQLKGKLPEKLRASSDRILDSLEQGKRVAHVDSALYALYRPSVQPYMISWMKYDPAQEIAKLKMPVLIVQGTTDLQVGVNEAKRLSSANPNAKLVLLEHMNHILKESEADLQKNLYTYWHPKLPLKAGLVKVIGDFVNAREGR